MQARHIAHLRKCSWVVKQASNGMVQPARLRTPRPTGRTGVHAKNPFGANKVVLPRKVPTKLAGSHSYYMRNRDRIRQKQRAYRLSHKAEIARKARAYRRRVRSGTHRPRRRISMGNSYVYAGY